MNYEDRKLLASLSTAEFRKMKGSEIAKISKELKDHASSLEIRRRVVSGLTYTKHLLQSTSLTVLAQRSACSEKTDAIELAPESIAALRITIWYALARLTVRS